jgi:hypothetical protein
MAGLLFQSIKFWERGKRGDEEAYRMLLRSRLTPGYHFWIERTMAAVDVAIRGGDRNRRCHGASSVPKHHRGRQACESRPCAGGGWACSSETQGRPQADIQVLLAEEVTELGITTPFEVLRLRRRRRK